MYRRTLVAGIGTTLLTASAGCVGELSQATGRNDAQTTDDAQTASSGNRKGIFRLTINPEGSINQGGQHVIIKNVSGRSLETSDYVVEFDTGQKYQLPSVEFPSGAKLYVITAGDKNVDEGGMDKAPPIYIRDANFSNPALKESGYVVIRNKSGEEVTRKSY